MKKQNKLSLSERYNAPTPKFFKRLRNIGLVLAAAGAAIVASPIALPVVVIQVAGYLTLAGSVISAVSEAAVDEEEVEVRSAMRSVAKEYIVKKQQSTNYT